MRTVMTSAEWDAAGLKKPELLLFTETMKVSEAVLLHLLGRIPGEFVADAEGLYTITYMEVVAKSYTSSKGKTFKQGTVWVMAPR
jgi:hypothetical protein